METDQEQINKIFNDFKSGGTGFGAKPMNEKDVHEKFKEMGAADPQMADYANVSTKLKGKLTDDEIAAVSREFHQQRNPNHVFERSTDEWPACCED